jgi:hypothetical protein
MRKRNIWNEEGGCEGIDGTGQAKNSESVLLLRED